MANPRPLAAPLLALVALTATAEAREVVELIPAQRSSWTIERLFAPISGLFLGGPDYWYRERAIEIDTRPAGASLDLFYVRQNVQQRFERSTAPILLKLPRRVDTGSRDSIEIRAMLDGYRQQVVQLAARSREARLIIELAPLPNRLEVLTHVHLARRGSLRFLTREAARFRIRETSDGFAVALTETAHSERALDAVRGTSSDDIESLRAEQLGEDLVVRVRLREAARDGLELRSTQGYDGARELHWLSIELIPAGGNAAVLAMSADALDRVEGSDVFGCALEFDRALREQLDAEALSRALSSASGFLDRHFKMALARLGELSPDGVIHLVDGSKFRPANPLDLEAARAQSAEVVGFLALLRAFVAELEPAEHRRSALRGAIAPELDRERFEAAVEIAEGLERRCREGGRRAREAGRTGGAASRRGPSRSARSAMVADSRSREWPCAAVVRTPRIAPANASKRSDRRRSATRS